MCTNDTQYANESAHYINRLAIPEGYEVELITITDACSMTSGYNRAMSSSDAKYKIYMHHDVMIIETDFLFHIIDIFQNKNIGAIGMVGVKKLADNAIMLHQKRIGMLYSCNIYHLSHFSLGTPAKPYEKVEALDGLLIATQYDIPWREDLFDKWDFYDVSQSFEFRNRGYDIVVPYMEKPWCIHDDGFPDLKEYYKERKKFIDEYFHSL